MNKIDSNVTGLAFAEETALKTLPGSPVWYALEPNSYSDFGGELSTVARNPINPSRQRQKGVITDLDASGGFNTDVTQNNLQRLLQGFFFADVREKATTKPTNGAAVAITAVASTGDTFAAASGLDIFTPGQIILASGFTDAANNGIFTAATVSATSIATTKPLTDETPTAEAKLQAVGYQFASGDAEIVASASGITLTTTTKDLTTLGLTVGEWVFVGGDATATRFASNTPGYARIKSIAANAIVFDDSTFTATTDDGAGKTIQLFFGSVLRNEKQSNLIKRRTYQVERQLGNDGNGIQSEYLVGAIPNELTLNVPQANKINVDLSFVATDNEQRDGTEGIKPGTRVQVLGENAFNTSSDIYRLRMNIVDPNNVNNAPLFGYVSELTLTLNNNVTPTKAIGVIGAFDATAGDFEVGGSVTAYFSTVAATKAVRANADVALNLIAAHGNAGMVFDCPLVGLSGGRVNVEKDNPITVPLDAAAAENKAGYTLLATFLPYVPTVGMPE